MTRIDRSCMSFHAGAAPARRARGIAWLAAFAALACAPGGYASVAVYVGKNLTKDGGVILAGFGDEPSSHWLSIVPRRQHATGETISVGGTPAAAMPGELITIPQVHETFRYIAMEYSFYRGLPAPLINGGLNEYGVAVRDVALSSRRELVEMTPKDQHGLNYSDIARIALERAHSARARRSTSRSRSWRNTGILPTAEIPMYSRIRTRAGFSSSSRAARGCGSRTGSVPTTSGSTGAATTRSGMYRICPPISARTPISWCRRTSFHSRSSRAGTNRATDNRSM